MAGQPKTRQRKQTQKASAQPKAKTSTQGKRQKPAVRKTEAVIQEMLWRVAGDARSLRQVCQDEDMPTYKTVYEWLNADPELRERYELARAERGDYLGERVVELSEQIVSGELDPQAGKNAIDGYKWVAGRMAPRSWGDRSALDMRVSRDAGEDHVSAVLELAERKKGRAPAPSTVPAGWSEDEADMPGDDDWRH
jgi:hypothetical protein